MTTVLQCQCPCHQVLQDICNLGQASIQRNHHHGIPPKILACHKDFFSDSAGGAETLSYPWENKNFLIFDKPLHILTHGINYSSHFMTRSEWIFYAPVSSLHKLTCQTLVTTFPQMYVTVADTGRLNFNQNLRASWLWGLECLYL